MENIEDAYNPGLAVGQQILEYRIEKIESLKEISAVYYVCFIWGPGLNTFTSAAATMKIPSAWPLRPYQKILRELHIFWSIPFCAVHRNFRFAILFFRCSKEA
jgi:hypothetical protein